MSVSAYVFVLTDMDKTAAVAEAIREISGVVETQFGFHLIQRTQ